MNATTSRPAFAPPPEGRLPCVAIIVLNWNGADDTLACLTSLEALTYPRFRVIVVDNGSTDDSLARLNAYSAPYSLTLAKTEKNLGYAGGNNVGGSLAISDGADLVLILNNDTTVSSDLLERLVEAAQRYPLAGVFSARLLYSDRPSTVCFDGACWNEKIIHFDWPGDGLDVADLSSEDHETAYACGAALFFRSEVAKAIGLLDESFFLVWEEVDWCYRARAAGWDVMVIADAIVWHKVGASFGTELSPLRTYFTTRNQLLWVERHGSTNARVRLAAKLLVQLIPDFHLGSDRDSALHKRLAWASLDYLRAWLGRGSRFIYLSKRRAAFDYVRRRFGDCPAQVRAWNGAWLDRRK